ncbi:DUF417 family protein [Pseudoalteromonas luteoviolacea]|uniref:DUF417 family protein n=1 Tax=Pseudoalteromonas luteoviolacea TaxID=43657 RepID=UPI0011521F2C|nr:DUF417 family protein [Pseudoalteromonas luteoviolacea]TQF72530.1 DUF417 family protein [Pseudoalteromonas luteoviolacea]
MQHKTLINLVTGLTAFSLFVFALSMMLGGNDRYVQTALKFYYLDSAISDVLAAQLLGGFIVIISALLVSRQPAFKNASMWGLTAIALLFLVTLFSESRWIQSHGGFPVIGSGQGIIKYFALLPIAVYLFAREKFSTRAHLWFNFFPVAVVLLWIGGMKFLELEAKGIEPLVSNSPFMSWLYDLFSVQMASNLIGIYDIFFTALLGAAIFLRHKPLFVISALACGAVFVMTQTFLITTPGALSVSTLLTGTGQFVIKDIWFICNLLILHHLINQTTDSISAEIKSEQQSSMA